jgi:phosphoglycerate dehydrogenase-like enzyme
VGETPWRLLALPPLAPAVLAGFAAGLDVELVLPERRDRSALLAALTSAELVIGDWSGQMSLDREALAAAPLLAAVVQPSVGTDAIDVAAAAAAGVPVANAAGSNTVSVAEWCIGAALYLLRRLDQADAEVRAGGWPQLQLRIGELATTPVGIIGMGAIGTALAHRLAAFGAPVSYWSRTRRPEGAVPARWQELPELLAGSRLLVVAIARSEQTRGLLDAAALARLPPGALLVNAARGDILDEGALVAALHSGALAGAALDVFGVEPLPPDSPLRTAPRLLLSPHVGGASSAALGRVLSQTRENLGRACRGESLRDVVNGVENPVRRRATPTREPRTA